MHPRWVAVVEENLEVSLSSQPSLVCLASQVGSLSGELETTILVTAVQVVALGA